MPVAPLRNFGFSLRQKGLFPLAPTLRSHEAKTKFHLRIIQVFHRLRLFHKYYAIYIMLVLYNKRK